MLSTRIEGKIESDAVRNVLTIDEEAAERSSGSVKETNNAQLGDLEKYFFENRREKKKDLFKCLSGKVLRCKDSPTSLAAPCRKVETLSASDVDKASTDAAVDAGGSPSPRCANGLLRRRKEKRLTID